MLIKLSGKFCFENAPWLYWSELLYGLEKEYIDSKEIIKFALEKLDINSSELHYNLVNVDEKDISCIQDLLRKMSREEELCEAKEVWIYLIFLWLYENRFQFDDPLEKVEELYADFNYPEQVVSFVRYMPSSSENSSEGNLLKNWEEMLAGDKVYFEKSRIKKK